MFVLKYLASSTELLFFRILNAELIQDMYCHLRVLAHFYGLPESASNRPEECWNDSEVVCRDGFLAKQIWC